MNKTNLVVILLLISGILCFVMPLIGLPGLIACSIFFIVQSANNKSRAKQCSMCNKKLTIYNTGAGGRLKDGGQLCASCLRSLYTDIADCTEKYSIEEIIVLQEAEKGRRWCNKMNYIANEKKKTYDKWLPHVQPVLQQEETVVHLMPAEYDQKQGILTLSNKRLLFVYLKPVKKQASSGFLSESYYSNLFTHEDIPASAITDVQMMSQFRRFTIRIFIAGFILDIDSYCQKMEVAEMVEQIKERASNTPPNNNPSNIKITITQTSSEIQPDKD